MKNGAKIVHLEFLKTGQHYYFGSLAAIYDMFTAEQIGVSLGTLWNSSKEGTYFNKKVIIRRGELHTRQTRRGGYRHG